MKPHRPVFRSPVAWSVLVVIVLFSFPGSSYGWPCKVKLKAYHDALTLMPHALRQLVRRWGQNPKPYLCSTHADTVTDVDRVTAYLDHLVVTVPDAMYRKRNLAAFLEMIPRASAILLELYDPANFPPASRFRKPFYDYTMKHLHQFPLVFYGYPDPVLDRGDLGAWTTLAVRKTVRWSHRFAAPSRYGLPRNPLDWIQLDYRSPAFAIAALNYQHGVTAVVRFWLMTWSLGHGTLRGLPVPRRQGVFILKRSSPYLKGR